MKYKVLYEQLKEAMKSGDKRTIKVLKEILGTAKNLGIDNKREPNEDDVSFAIQKAYKVYKEQVDTCPEDRQDKMEEYKGLLSMVESYMPKQLSEDEVRSLVNEILDNEKPSNMGMAMKAVMPKLKGKADGKLINQIVKEWLE